MLITITLFSTGAPKCVFSFYQKLTQPKNEGVVRGGGEKGCAGVSKKFVDQKFTIARIVQSQHCTTIDLESPDLQHASLPALIGCIYIRPKQTGKSTIHFHPCIYIHTYIHIRKVTSQKEKTSRLRQRKKGFVKEFEISHVPWLKVRNPSFWLATIVNKSTNECNNLPVNRSNYN